VICADEKPSIQARRRIHETLAPTSASRGQRIEHTYERMGALTYLAALDIGRRGGRRPKVFGRSERRGGIVGFDRLVWQVMTRSPTPPRAGSSGSSTTAPPTAASARSTASKAAGPT
jgi:hypothetical protein